MECAHEYEIRYSKQHPGKVAECPTCENKYLNGQLLIGKFYRKEYKTDVEYGFSGFKGPEIVGQLDYVRPTQRGRLTGIESEAENVIDNKKVVSAVSTIQALTPEEYALVLALTKREVEKVVVKRGPRKKKGLPEAVAESKTSE